MPGPAGGNDPSVPDRLVKVGTLPEIPQGRSKRVVVDGTDIALWHAGGRVFAIGNVCAHQHISALHQGTLEGTMVTCPMHGWTYSLETGRAVSGEGRVRTYRVVMAGIDILIELPSPGGGE